MFSHFVTALLCVIVQRLCAVRRAPCAMRFNRNAARHFLFAQSTSERFERLQQIRARSAHLLKPSTVTRQPSAEDPAERASSVF